MENQINNFYNIQYKNLYGVQFHPEKSGHNGLAEVHGQMNLWNGPIHQAESWSQLAKAF